jgi:hypothetical protein
LAGEDEALARWRRTVADGRARNANVQGGGIDWPRLVRLPPMRGPLQPDNAMHTVLSAFDSRAEAERAVDSLLKEGYLRENIHVESPDDAASTADSVDARTAASPEREVAVSRHGLAAIERFFERLLGRGEHAHHARRYSEAVHRGGSVVAVDTTSPTTAERAATVMKELGAYDIEERSEQWQRDGWTGASASGGRTLPDGTQVRWRTAHIWHRGSEPPLSELAKDRRTAGQPQPWHAADERPADEQPAQRGDWHEGPADLPEPDPFAEPRANTGDLLGRRG